MIRGFLFFLAMTLQMIACSQDSVWVEVTVISKTERETVHNVNATVTVNSESFYEQTNMQGQFGFSVKRGSAVQFKLSHAQFAYSEEFKRISTKAAEDTVAFTFEMEFLKTKELEDIVVYAPGVPSKVYESNRLHVADFVIQNDGNLLLLTYAKQLKKGSELLLYNGRKVLQNFQVPSVAHELISDFRGNPHVLCDEMVYGVHSLENGGIGISSMPRDYYMTYVAPIVDTNLSRVYFSNFNPDYPAFDYYVLDQLDSSYKKIMEVEDELMMELYRSEYKWVDVRTQLWAKNLELQTGIDAEIYVGANYFTQSIYYKELYAPMFQRNDSLFLFDYYKDKLFTFNANGEVIDSIGIYHHYNPKSTGWEKQLIQDRKTGKIYALFDRAGYTYLGYIDTKTGEISEQVKLTYRYVDKVAVYENSVYYIYREFESPDKRMLWTERLPYDFGEASTPNGDAFESKAD